MSKKEKLTAIIGIRVYPSWKEKAKKEALKRGMTLSDLVKDVKQHGEYNKGHRDNNQRSLRQV